MPTRDSARRWRVIDRGGRGLLDHLKKVRNFSDDELGFDYLSQIHDPMLLPDIDKAIEIIRSLDKDQDKIIVFGDYDSDGTPATALLMKGLRRCGFVVDGALPRRDLGYGLREEQVREFAERYSLLITVDNGITSVEQISLAKQLGMRVIVLDHHLPLATLPPADAIVDPFRADSIYPFPELCGCALGHKLLTALSRDFPELTEGFLKWQLDLVAISTISDMMRLRDENRTLVYYGLKVLKKTKNIGLRALIKIAGIKQEEITAETVGWTIGPRLNALGRLSDNRPALDLLLAEDELAADALAKEINASNTTRQKQVAEVLAQAKELIWRQNRSADHLFVLVGESWPAGVIGLVASRLTGEFSRPVLVATSGKDGIVGSARSIDLFNLVAALESCQESLVRFGGHSQAAGFTIKEGSLERFVKEIKGYARKRIPKSDLVKTELADAILSPAELSFKTCQIVSSFAPFGLGNREPRFILPEARIVGKTVIGKDRNHLKLTIDYQGVELEIVGFGFASDLEVDRAHLMITLEQNSWNGRTRLQGKLCDYLPAEQKFEILTDNNG